jgi:hypothetical protein
MSDAKLSAALRCTEQYKGCYELSVVARRLSVNVQYSTYNLKVQIDARR